MKSLDPFPGNPTFPLPIRQCNGCGALGYPDDIYCAACGAAMEPVAADPRRRCRACHAIIRHPVALYCSRCGAALDDVR